MVITTSLTGVHALVTGATSGLGQAMAEALLSAGATVAVSARPTRRLDAAVRHWAERGLAAEARGVTGERIVATEFGQWLAAFRAARAGQRGIAEAAEAGELGS